MKRPFLLPLLVSVLLLFNGCGEDNIGSWGLKVEIRDARTGAPAAYDATLIVQAGSYADTVQGRVLIIPEHKGQEAVLMAAEQRTGTFQITILHPEYRAWQREGIRVEAAGSVSPVDGSPHPRTVHVLAELEPLKDL